MGKQKDNEKQTNALNEAQTQLEDLVARTRKSNKTLSDFVERGVLPKFKDMRDAKGQKEIRERFNNLSKYVAEHAPEAKPIIANIKHALHLSRGAERLLHRARKFKQRNTVSRVGKKRMANQLEKIFGSERLERLEPVDKEEQQHHHGQYLVLDAFNNPLAEVHFENNGSVTFIGLSTNDKGELEQMTSIQVDYLTAMKSPESLREAFETVAPDKAKIVLSDVNSPKQGM